MTNPAYPTEIEGRRFPGSDAECFIQWKGTDVCVDIYCPCDPDEPRHLDDWGAYQIRCRNCGTVYAMGTQVHMRRLEPHEISKYVKTTVDV